VTRPAGDRVHDCPGACSRKVARHKLACPSCWRRVPAPLQRRLNETYRAHRAAPLDDHRARQHRLSIVAVLAWYRDNPPAGRP
jgi:hypothetical protein